MLKKLEFVSSRCFIVYSSGLEGISLNSFTSQLQFLATILTESHKVLQERIVGNTCKISEIKRFGHLEKIQEGRMAKRLLLGHIIGMREKGNPGVDDYNNWSRLGEERG